MLGGAHNQKHPAHTTRPTKNHVLRGRLVLPDPSGPNNVSDTHPNHRHVPLPHVPKKTQLVLVSDRLDQVSSNRCSTLEHPLPHTRGQTGLWHHTDQTVRAVLLRKEVIQPHLPVRLPCYDLVPIASPTFDGSPHKGWATGFGCYRLS
jgi:hypothetical protein